MLAIIWTCCTAISAGNMADGSSVAEGSHVAGISTGILRAAEGAVKENKQGTAKKESNTEQKRCHYTCMCECLRNGEK